MSDSYLANLLRCARGEMTALRPATMPVFGPGPTNARPQIPGGADASASQGIDGAGQSLEAAEILGPGHPRGHGPAGLLAGDLEPAGLSGSWAVPGTTAPPPIAVAVPATRREVAVNAIPGNVGENAATEELRAAGPAVRLPGTASERRNQPPADPVRAPAQHVDGTGDRYARTSRSHEPGPSPAPEPSPAAAPASALKPAMARADLAATVAARLVPATLSTRAHQESGRPATPPPSAADAIGTRPDVTISIGHIEVRAAPPAEQPRTRQPFRPQVALDDFLSKRQDRR